MSLMTFTTSPRRRLRRVLLLLLATAATGQEARIGECPEIDPIVNFNATAFTGVWYESLKFANKYTDGLKCVTTRVSTNHAGVFVFDTAGYRKFFRPVRMRGYAIQTFGPAVGSLSVGIPIANNIREPNLSLIDVDYGEYAVLYSCTNKLYGFSHLEWLCVMTRTPRLRASVMRAILGRLAQFGLRTRDLRPTKQEPCPANVPGN